MARERRNDEVDEREEGEGSEENGEVGREGSEPCVKGVGGACPWGCKTWALEKVMVITYESRVTGCRTASLMYESCRVSVSLDLKDRFPCFLFPVSRRVVVVVEKEIGDG